MANTCPKNKRSTLLTCFNPENRYEIGIDEAGRGPLFGRLYVAAAILPKDDSFNHGAMRDSKKFTSKKKIADLAEYIKENSVAWSVQYIEAEEIDRINIRQAVLKAMHQCITDILEKKMSAVHGVDPPFQDYMLLVDGNDFKPYTRFDAETGTLECMRHETITGGDNSYTAIAAASILAKVARDSYIADLCKEYPELVEKYGLDTNMGYGTKKHMDGIKAHGITRGHRLSYAPVRNAIVHA
jgi:ribonuclease HII